MLGRVLVAGLLVLGGCAPSPLKAEIEKACAGAPDPAACAKEKYAAAFAEERARFNREGLFK